MAFRLLLSLSFLNFFVIVFQYSVFLFIGGPADETRTGLFDVFYFFSLIFDNDFLIEIFDIIEFTKTRM